MKRYIISFLIILLNISVAFTNDTEICNAIRQGNADKIAEYFGNNVDLKILSKENVFSKLQATVLLKDFFSTHKPEKFEIKHEGGPENAKFAIGILSDTNGNTYRIYYLLKSSDNKVYIHKFRIEEDG